MWTGPASFYLGFLEFRLDWEHRFEPAARVYMRFMQPAIGTALWRARVMEVVDPFGNRLHFNEDLAPEPAAPRSATCCSAAAVVRTRPARRDRSPRLY